MCCDMQKKVIREMNEQYYFFLCKKRILKVLFMNKSLVFSQLLKKHMK